jgi:hypothetical protein
MQRLLTKAQQSIEYLRQFVQNISAAIRIWWNGGSDKMDQQDNLATLHGEEERLRTVHIGQVAADKALRDHIDMIRNAMNMIFALTHDHINTNDNELVMQYLGIRMFNAAAASMKLAYSGYYQNAFSALRDFLETFFLVDYLTSFPEKIQDWKGADEKQLRAIYGPGAIRNALDARDGFKEKKRKKLYDMISHYATHAAPSGFHLVTKDDLGMIGPFYRPELFVAWMQEAVKMICNSGLVFAKAFKDVDWGIKSTRKKYRVDLKTWSDKYIEGKG